MRGYHTNHFPRTETRRMVYTAQTAQASYEERRVSSISKGKYTSELAEEIESKPHKTWSREQIAEKARAEGKPPGKTRTFSGRQPIQQRANEVRKRKTFGHWELDTVDTVVSRRGISKACATTFIECKTLMYYFVL